MNTNATEINITDDMRFQEIIERIVRVAQPEKIILFGSSAHGILKPDSDIDLLVVKSGVNRGELSGQIYEALIGVGLPVDIVVAHPEDLEQYGNCPATVFYPALREGSAVYAA
jgi:uncharacterized protein